MRVMKTGRSDATPIVVSDELNRTRRLAKLGKLIRRLPTPKRGYTEVMNFDEVQTVTKQMAMASMEELQASTSLPTSPSLLADYRPLTRGSAGALHEADPTKQRDAAQQRKKGKKTNRNNDVLTSSHPALIRNPKPLSFVVTKDSSQGELALTLDRNGVTVEAINGSYEFMRTPMLSVPWYRVKSYEKHIKGHQFALVYQHMSRSRPDRPVLRRVVYNTDESEIIFKAMKRYIGWVAYHS